MNDVSVAIEDDGDRAKRGKTSIHRVDCLGLNAFQVRHDGILDGISSLPIQATKKRNK